MVLMEEGGSCSPACPAGLEFAAGGLYLEWGWLGQPVISLPFLKCLVLLRP